MKVEQINKWFESADRNMQKKYDEESNRSFQVDKRHVARLLREQPNSSSVFATSKTELRPIERTIEAILEPSELARFRVR